MRPADLLLPFVSALPWRVASLSLAQYLVANLSLRGMSYFELRSCTAEEFPLPNRLQRRPLGRLPRFVRESPDSDGRIRCCASSCCTNSFTSVRACSRVIPNSDARCSAICSGERPSLSCCQMIDPIGFKVSIEPPWISMSTAPSWLNEVRMFSEMRISDPPECVSSPVLRKVVQVETQLLRPWHCSTT